MKLLLILFSILAVLGLLTILISYICFRIAFYAPRKPLDPELIETPDGKLYDPYRENMIRWIKEDGEVNYYYFTFWW